MGHQGGTGSLAAVWLQYGCGALGSGGRAVVLSGAAALTAAVLLCVPVLGSMLYHRFCGGLGDSSWPKL